MFDPKTDKISYPDVTDRHYLKIKKNRGIVFDTKYPYIDKSVAFRFKQRLVHLLLIGIVFPLCYIRLGLKIEGKQNLKNNRELLKDGAISVANHIHMWDYIAVMRALWPCWPNLLSWAANVNDVNGPLVRLVGGIPIPEKNMAATKVYMKAIESLLKEDKGWLHIYSEGSMWEYYAPIRPFKRGASYIACECDKPIVPMAFSYRKPGWIRKHIFRQIATFTLRIGEPILPNKNLNPRERERDLTIRTHERVCELAGIAPGENLYPPIFDNNARVDY